jgi:hypothetical protein
MEPRGCNRWQPVANQASRKRLKSAETATGCHQLPESFHGKEEVDRSPSVVGDLGSLHYC